MFIISSKCFHSSLIEINLSNFTTNKVENMSKIFSKCSSLKIITIPNFNIYNVKNITKMFAKCSSLKELKLI